MIITLIILTTTISILHYFRLEGFALMLVNNPTYCMVITGMLIIVRLLMWFYRFVPTFRRMFRRTENFLNRYENKESPFLNGGSKRKFSTGASKRPLSSKVVRKQKGNTTFKAPSFLDAIKSKFHMVNKVVPLSNKLIGTVKFKTMVKTMFYLSLGRINRLAFRANCAKNFFGFLLFLQKEHGSTFTIKWLKAGYVAIQKELGQNGMTTLRDIDPSLPLPRLAGRLPRIIPVSDRNSIKNGDVTVIRFWSSLFNLYRILKCDGALKISTITAPFSGNEEVLASTIEDSKVVNPFQTLKGWSKFATMNLSPVKFVMSRSASPSAKTAAHGILTDIYNLYTYRKDLYEQLHYLAYSTFPQQTAFMQLIADGYDIISDFVAKDSVELVGKSGMKYVQGDHLMTKNSIRIHGSPDNCGGLSQFAIKVEAAGKVRVFALLDSLSQTFLAPIHEALFDLLRRIPNDGTFDQDKSVQRCQVKAMENNRAFSFDLTAATDRIPALLSAGIISLIFTNELLGAYWLKVMTDRDFAFNSKIAEKYNVSPGPYRYAVGQPMGGLSSWAMLALTHHWIVQYCASKVGNDVNKAWYEGYEILGDDLVIFDPQVADKYLELMSSLGCEINMNKSIVSKSRPVFEFAKRTCWGLNTVSGISFNQLSANKLVGSRIANVLSFAKSGLISSSSILLSLITEKSQTDVSALKEHVSSVSLLALLGSLYQQGKVSLLELVTALIHPKDGLEGEVLDLPKTAVLNLAFERLSNHDDSITTTESSPWS